jgi:tyrosyl-tRNA synthetase
VCGVDLGRKMGGVPPLFGLTTPLLTTAQGHKMGKTAAGAVWLSAERLAPSEYWQFWRNTDDADVERFFFLFTSLPADEIRRIVHNEEINRQKIILADQATALCHGPDVLPGIHGKVARFFGAADLQEDEHPACAPDLVLDAGESSIPVTALLVRLGWAASNSEARRLVRHGAVQCGDKPVTDETVCVSELAGSRPVFALSAGRKRHALVQVQAEETEGKD